MDQTPKTAAILPATVKVEAVAVVVVVASLLQLMPPRSFFRADSMIFQTSMKTKRACRKRLRACRAKSKRVVILKIKMSRVKAAVSRRGLSVAVVAVDAVVVAAVVVGASKMAPLSRRALMMADRMRRSLRRIRTMGGRTRVTTTHALLALRNQSRLQHRRVSLLNQFACMRSRRKLNSRARKCSRSARNSASK
jgi:hypothetical protein